ncbi:hypothetical protein E3P81_00544 [Wallemia ichthyophaga]|nr:hypothetical protein E3P97_00546 [Wallemia ichthyophaga]TIB29937.1 hypothetical protein E3P85_02940 [Wallemia ichthyophaga]TIB50323.1 hypothetical protein E3P82_00493 [Wallemia ichthyophaga]TIB53876.1 hypothetical protein E3P81_00544 [Wallemia ichthyophaga]TIB56497.1 hypothetical protein E3P80_00493 [Wallemia ichthyophaga]
MNQLAVPYKQASDIDIPSAVNDFLTRKNIPPQSLESDVSRWSDLRRRCMLQHAQNSFPEYLHQLTYISTRLPRDIISFDFATPFPHTAAFSTEESYALADIHYEKAALLFNIAAAFSQSAAQRSRASTDGIKAAIQDLQLSAGAFDLLSDSLSALKTHTATTPDLAPDYIRTLSTLMLAQAQECYWQKAVLDNLKNGSIAKVSMGVSNLYEEACQFALNSTPPPADALPPIWIAHMQVKAHHFAAAAQYRRSLDDLSASRYGHELSRLNLASELVKKAIDFTHRNRVLEAVRHDLKGLHETVLESLARGTKDNDLIYLHDVPTPHHLPAIAPARMVRGVVGVSLTSQHPTIPPDALLFARLTPLAVDAACELWGNRKRSRVRELEQHTAHLDKMQAEALHALNLPGSLQAGDRRADIPPGLLRKTEEVGSDGGLNLLDRLVDDVQLLALGCEGVLDEAVDLLALEEDEDGRVRAQQSQSQHENDAHTNTAGVADVQVSSIAHAPLAQEIQSLQHTLEAASRSDGIVQQKMAAARADLELISSDVECIRRSLPSHSHTAHVHTHAHSLPVDENTRSLRSALEKLDDLADDRRVLVQDVKSIVKRDDIRTKIIRVFEESMRSESGVSEEHNQNNQHTDTDTDTDTLSQSNMAIFDALFEDEMRKYDEIFTELETNSSSQDALLSTTRQLYSLFEKRKQTDAGYVARQDKLQALDLAYYTYIEIKNNLNEGLQFYNNFSQLAHGLKGGVDKFIHHRRLERQVAIEKLSKHIESLTLHESRESITNSPLKSFARIPDSPSHQFGEWDESKPIRFG